MLIVILLVVLLCPICGIVDTSVTTSQSFKSKGIELTLELTRSYQWGKHLVENIPIKTTIPASVYFFGGFVELGFGYKGLLNAGIAYRIKARKRNL